MKHYIAIDLETTGPDCAKHGIVQIGAWCSKRQQSFSEVCNPGDVLWDPAAMLVNGVRWKAISEARAVDKVVTALGEWMAVSSNAVAVMHNAPFDVGFLHAALARSGSRSDRFRRVVDTVALGFAAFGEVMSLEHLAARLSVNGPWKQHDAGQDARMTARVFEALCRKLDVP